MTSGDASEKSLHKYFLADSNTNNPLLINYTYTYGLVKKKLT